MWSLAFLLHKSVLCYSAVTSANPTQHDSSVLLTRKQNSVIVFRQKIIRATSTPIQQNGIYITFNHPAEMRHLSSLRQRGLVSAAPVQSYERAFAHSVGSVHGCGRSGRRSCMRRRPVW